MVAAGREVDRVAVGDRVLGCYGNACGRCFICRRGLFHKCDDARVFGHGATLGSLQGAQAEQVLVPHADLTLRKVPDGISDQVALFAGDVMGTGYHAIEAVEIGPGEFGATPVHLTAEDPGGAVKAATEGRGVDGAVDAVGHPDALNLACRLARKAGIVSATGVYAERIQLHMGAIWIKALTLKSGRANVIKHVDPVLEKLASGELDPTPLVTHHLKLEQAPEAYEIYDRREALKIVLTP